MGLTDAKIISPADVANCTAEVLEPGAQRTCTVAINAAMADFEAGQMVMLVNAQADNRAVAESVITGQDQKTVTLTKAPSMSASITLATGQTSTFTTPGAHAALLCKICVALRWMGVLCAAPAASSLDHAKYMCHPRLPLHVLGGQEGNKQ